jgi:hypothetical protein
MSLLHRPPPPPSALPKPPPKALPQRQPPSGPPPARTLPAAAAATPAVATPAAATPATVSVAAAAPAAAPAPLQAPPSAATRPAPSAALPAFIGDGLTPSMAAMMEAVRLYEDLLVEENALLRAGDASGVTALLDRKMNATRLYQERQRSVLGDPEATRSLTPDQRTQVVAMVRSLEELATENTILLKANMSAIQQLFEVINTAARKMRKREVSYSQAGVIRDYHQAHNLSLAYNHVV